MLLRFEASNHRSIMRPVEFSMVAVDEDRAATRSFDSLEEQVLTVAGIYGPNASGKSNVVEALAWLSEAVRLSLRAWDGFIPRPPFKFGSGPTSPSTYEIDKVVDGVRHTYRVEVDDAAVLFEGLYSYPERRRRMLFEREGQDLRFRRGLPGLTATRELLTRTTLALSAAVRFAGPEVQAVGRSIADMSVLGLQTRRRPSGPAFASGHGWPPTSRLFDGSDLSAQPTLFDETSFKPVDARDSALSLLRFADLGIDDVTLVEESDETQPAGPQPRRTLRFVHRVADQELPFDITEESAGTQTWFRLIGPMLNALRYGRILLFDEIDASLHPQLSARMLDLFEDPQTNPNGAQLIFTTHDTSLLNHLNRDEVWLTEKGNDGATTLTALAEYGGEKVRRSLNLERAYLQGRFGALPKLDQLVLLRALGLAPDV